MKILRTARLVSNFTGHYRKKEFILKVSSVTLGFTSYQTFLKTIRRLELVSLPHFCMIFGEKYIFCCILLTDQISLFVCLYFVRYWAMCVL